MSWTVDDARRWLKEYEAQSVAPTYAIHAADNMRSLLAERDALVLGAEKFHRVLMGWSEAYPTDVFPEPPPGEHGKTVDACSAAMGRHMSKSLIADFKEVVLQALAEYLRKEIEG